MWETSVVILNLNACGMKATSPPLSSLTYHIIKFASDSQ